tara:strand:+ start:44828 stop:45394 length:567 start_codon:yes stop_codon:yes gene_type:complete
MKKIFGYDTETTGLPVWSVPSGDEQQPHLVQLAGSLCNDETGEVLDKFDVIIKPDGWVILQETIDIHGITNEYALEFGIPEKEAISMLLEMRGDAERVAYNKTFDQRIIRIGLKRYFSEAEQEKWAVKDDHHCAMRMAKAAMKVKSVKLIDAYKHFTGEDMVGAHNAMADTDACMKVYFAALKESQAA